mmetsp:Transcript_49982/g.82882  ORF Transcript_49982/g.82882 Transcript_49982/m.82882 type:complete len:208 (-) Transcript_49982:186-809(-)
MSCAGTRLWRTCPVSHGFSARNAALSLTCAASSLASVAAKASPASVLALMAVAYAAYAFSSSLSSLCSAFAFSLAVDLRVSSSTTSILLLAYSKYAGCISSYTRVSNADVHSDRAPSTCDSSCLSLLLERLHDASTSTSIACFRPASSRCSRVHSPTMRMLESAASRLITFNRGASTHCSASVLVAVCQRPVICCGSSALSSTHARA